MALAHIKFKVGSKGRAVKHFDYIMREDEYERLLGGDDNDQVLNKGFGNMPAWAKDDPKFFWQSADDFERKNGTAYREHIISLPRELTLEENLELVNAWIKQEIGDRHPYQFALHNKKALDGEQQPHLHLMYSDRLNNDGIERSPDMFFKRANNKNPEKGGAKKHSPSQTYTERRIDLKAKRNRWGELCNEHLAKAGVEARVDMRNWKEKGLSEKPRNFSMQEMNKPEIRQAYIDELQTKKEIKTALWDFEHYSMIADHEREQKANEEKRLAEVAEYKAKIEAERQATAKAEAEQKQAQSLEYARLAQIEEQRREADRISKLEAQGKIEKERQPLYEIVKSCFEKIRSGGSYKLALDEVCKAYDKYLPKCKDQSQPEKGKGYEVGFGDDFKLMSDGRLGVKNQFGDQRYTFYRASDVIEISDKKRDSFNQLSANLEIRGSGEQFNSRGKVAWADSVIDTIERSGSEKYAPLMYDTPTPFSHQSQTNDKSMERRNDYGLGF